MARRSPPRSIGTRAPARSAIAYRSLHRHSHARVLGFGRTPMISPSSSQSGVRWRSRICSRSRTTRSDSVTVMPRLLGGALEGATTPRVGRRTNELCGVAMAAGNSFVVQRSFRPATGPVNRGRSRLFPLAEQMSALRDAAVSGRDRAEPARDALGAGAYRLGDREEVVVVVHPRRGRGHRHRQALAAGSARDRAGGRGDPALALADVDGVASLPHDLELGLERGAG